ncbi:hypothetical protein [Nocardioides exalbidus]|uniref:hypothetical protein n=1 Tax=Nocardioides exalbidus TaxID=402596 RepID=UPI0011150A24|nr:hypothetical protein [Nocardioides exalbidus]
MLLDFSGNLTRTAHSLGYASNFFDIQARSLLDGKLSVPRGSLGIEGFVERGQEYMYFGPFPALLRIPVMLTTDEFDGRLTLVSMALAFAVYALMATKLIWLVRDVVREGVRVTRIEAAAMSVLIAATLGGTSLTFNASLPWVYHEVYAWSVALITGSLYWLVRLLQQQSIRSTSWFVAFTVCTVLTRATGGWAMCLGAAMAGLWLYLGRSGADRRREGLMLVGFAAAALSIGALVNWMKFRHPFLFPLEDQVWTRFSPQRREALAVNGGSITGPQFFLTSLVNYFRPDGIRFVEYFPWITLPADPARAYGGAFIDQSYRTGSITAFMPLHFLATCVATVTLVRPQPREVRKLRIPFAASILVTAGVMAYGYLAYRYTCEFVPALVLGAAIGVPTTVGWLDRRSKVLRRGVLAMGVALAAFAIAANMLTGYATAAMTAGGSSLNSYLELQRRLTPAAERPAVIYASNLPDNGATDSLLIVGDCESLYVNSGDFDREWRPVEHRALVIDVSFSPKFSEGTVNLVDVGTDRSIRLETTDDGFARVVIVDKGEPYAGPYVEMAPGQHLDVGVGVKGEFGYGEVSSEPGGFVGYVRAFSLDGDGIAQPETPVPAFTGASMTTDFGIVATGQQGLALPLCRSIARSAGLDTSS